MGSATSRFKVMTLTDAAAERVREIMADQDKPVVALRVGVKNGGCAGMSYTMEWAESVGPQKRLAKRRALKISRGHIPPAHRRSLSACLAPVDAKALSRALELQSI